MDVARFGDLYKSAIGKAVNLGPSAGGVTLGPNAVPFAYKERVEEPRVRKKSGRLDIPAIRQYFEIKSVKEVERKMLLAEMEKTQKRKADLFVVNLESAAQTREEGIVRRMSRLFEERKLQEQARNVDLAKRLQNTVAKKNDGVDRVAENRAQVRSEKIKQNLEDAKRKILEDAKRKNLEKKRILEGYLAWEESFNSTYQQVLKVVNDNPCQKSLYDVIGPYLPSMKSSVQFIESCDAKAKRGELSDEDLKSADAVLKNMKKVLKIVTIESEKIKQIAIDAKKREEEEERLRVEKEEQIKQQSVQFSDEISLQMFADFRQLLLKTHLDLEAFVKNKQLSDYRCQLQKASTLPVNSISPDSPQHMMDKYRKLYGLFSGARIEGTNISTNDHPQGGLFVKELVARLFVDQAARVVSSKPEAAYALASVLVNLWVDFPDFGQLVRAHFFEKCPYLVPAFLPKCDNQTNEEYYK